MAVTDDDTVTDATLASGDETPSLEQLIKRLTRSNKRMSWALIVLVLLVTGVAGFEIKMMQDRLGEMEGGVNSRVSRANDDFARIQDQTAAMRGGIELLHKEMGQVRRQIDAVDRRLRRSEN